ncbi:hypothetical protein ACQKEF_21075 [Pseudomonas oryzihabitans]|uniref:hypothetical protein n=1 Tax=Pseudomonas oryzihabitans TaxID=47885 RepID=UPI003D01BFB1
MLLGTKTASKFIQHTIDPGYHSADHLTLTPVRIPNGQKWLPKAECIEAGVSAEHWSIVRMAMVISGKSATGAILADFDWLGTRDEYDAGGCTRDAHRRAKELGITQPAFFSVEESGHVLRAAEFFNRYNLEMRPSARVAHVVWSKTEDAILGTDFSGVTHDQALQYLADIQQACRQRRDFDLAIITPAAGTKPSENRFVQMNRPEPRLQGSQEDPEPDVDLAVRPKGPRLH